MSTFETVIGLEIHAEMMSASKMFCGCRVVDSVEAAPNVAVCPVCLGMPGMLPVINRRAVEFAMRVALALNCTIQTHNVFARKNYFYPDLPKGYQISQYELPLARDGWVDITLSSGEHKRVRVRRVHMEEDTGKLTHLENGSGSLVDYNRSGVPLLEIVSEPDMRTAEEAQVYGAKVRQILRYLEVNSGDMEKGVIRFEANISIRPAGADVLNTRTEVKNLNSFRALTGSIEFERERQINIVTGGGQVRQDTLGWNETLRETFSQRGKEEADDYRYFPEPDLPPLHIADSWIEAVKATLTELPDAKLARYTEEFGLSEYDATLLAEDRPVAEWFDAAVIAGGAPKQVANWVLNNLFSLLNEHKLDIEAAQVTPAGLVALLDLVTKKTINNNTAKEVLADMVTTGRGAAEIVEAKGLAQISDEAALFTIIQQIITDNPQQLETYLGGKEQVRGWFVGQVMKATRGKANPGLVNKLLAQELNRRKSEAAG